MKRFILTYLVLAFVLSVETSQTHAQIFRRACPGGACPTAYQRVYVPYSWRQENGPAPCEATVETVEAQEPCAPAETVEPCAPVETVEPCAPVQACAPVEYLPECKQEDTATVETTTIDGCVGGSCPIRTAAKATAGTAIQTVRNVAATTRFLLAANRIRAQYNLPALRADTALDSGCESQAAYCSRVGQLVHGGNNAEILAYNYSGFDAALVQWLNSPEHRSLLLAPGFRAAGVAVVRGRDGRVWCAMRFR